MSSKEKVIKVIEKKGFKKSEMSAEVYEIAKSVGLTTEKKFFSTVKKALKQREKELNILKNDVALLSALEKQEVYADYFKKDSAK